MSYLRLGLFFLLPLWLTPLSAITTDQLLLANQAFKLNVNARSLNEVVLSWQIADGYYLYQTKFKFQSKTPSIQLGKVTFPNGERKQDELFGNVLIYRHALSISIPLLNPEQRDTLQLTVNYQGCADVGVCYPPQQQQLTLHLADTNSALNPLAKLTSGFKGLTADLFPKEELLPAAQAFQFFSSLKNPTTAHLSWQLAEGYYLYREKITLRSQTPGVEIGDYQIPRGTPKHDEAFGDVEIFHQNLEFDVGLIRSTSAAQTIHLEASYQGCADRGVCYPPMKSRFSLDLPAIANPATATPASTSTAVISEQDQIIQQLQQDNFAWTLLSFLGFGLLLSLTPCMFPMIPILSGLIIGQGKQLSSKKSFGLSLSYVLATALTYTVFGILAALFGHNLQMNFQQPWVITVFSSIFIALSLSMFGFYELQLPDFIQTRLNPSKHSHRDGSYLSAALMGALSSLIVGPCVAAPLAGALIYIGKTGDILLGGSALFMLGFGMGVPLLIMGASAGKLLPKAGDWLTVINPIFGVIMLAVALWMLERILPPWMMMLFWAMWLIIPAIYLNALEPLPYPCSGWRKLWKGLGIILLSYGILLLIGLGLGNTNPLKPLQIQSDNHSNVPLSTAIRFERIRSSRELDQRLQTASQQKRWLMLDFYADWCISCKEMEAYTFSDPQVKQRLAALTLLQVDVSANTEADQALLKRFNLVGPPAILFFAPDQHEQAQYRVIGYQDSETFLKQLEKLGKN
jgi:thiol:disulfide interchange protein DsbD